MYQQIIDFWFSELTAEDWWRKNPELDELIKTRFGELHQSATKGELFEWRSTPLGSLAEILILDQFSRHIFRNNEKAFAYDSMALTLAQVAVAKGFDKEVSLDKRFFFYLPYEHSESPLIHQKAVSLFSTKGLEEILEYELKHKKIIDRFGRYPHRNTILKRKSTQEELEFLKEPNSSF